MKKRYQTNSAVFLIIENPKGEILFQRRLNTGYLDGMLDLGASGHVEEGETAKQAAQRELMEETGLVVAFERLTFVCVNHRKSQDAIYYDFYFKVLVRQDELVQIKNNEPEKVSEILWLNPSNLSKDVIDYNRLVIEQMADGVYYHEIGWEHNI